MAVAMTGIVALLAIIALATASLGLAYSARAQAAAAADAAALAAATASFPGTHLSSPVHEARRVAARNGARLVSCVCQVDSTLRRRSVTVVAGVPVDLPVLGKLEVRVASRAEFDPLRWLGR